MKQKIMTQEQYLTWIKTRHSDAALWDRDACIAADNLIKTTALDNFKRYTDRLDDLPKSVKNYLFNTVRVTFGSIETDNLLTELGMYPEWMEVNRG